MFVIGTAGHIDHGKSSIITRLTGIDPDRLPEEKERGMTIDIGFAYYDTTDGNRIGIIDVPGHERFVRNMIAGAAGIDALILVVAADDGWMPQSQEHLQIAELLGVKYGFVVLSKIDLVEKSWFDLVLDDVRDKVRGTFLENAPIIRLSSETGEGFDKLKEEIDKLSQQVIDREDIGKPRLYIDRSFVLAGMGGVVAGTLRGGRLEIGQEVIVFPARRIGKVRTMQSHNEQIRAAYPGQRTSISLTGIDKEYLSRGSVITSPEIIQDYSDKNVLAMSVLLIPESRIILTDRRKLLMILGTTEVVGEIRIYKDYQIAPGEKGIVFFEPCEPLLAFIGDKFILRLPTPQRTIGGGTVLDSINRFPRKREMKNFAYLEERLDLTPERLVTSELTKTSFIDKKASLIRCNLAQSSIDGAIDNLIKDSKLDEYDDKYYLPDSVNPTIESVLSGMEKYFENRPHLDGLPIDIISSVSNVPIQNLESLLELMNRKRLLIKKGNRFDLSGRKIAVKGDVEKAAEIIEGKILKGGFAPPSIKEILGNDKINKEAFNYLSVSGRIVKVGSTLAFHESIWREILGIIHELLEKNDSLMVAALRERLSSSRKYIIPILEETDRLKITARQGDVRVKGDRFEKE